MASTFTHEQFKAFQKLKRAFRDCEKAGLHVWDNYGTIEAVNGHIMSCPVPNNLLPIQYDGEGEWFTSDCWRGSNADDTLYYERKTPPQEE